MLELVDCHLPWHGVSSAAGVPHRVVKESTIGRPTQQLAKDEGGSGFMSGLIQRCWAHVPAERPSFTEVVQMLAEEQERLHGVQDRQQAAAEAVIGGRE